MLRCHLIGAVAVCSPRLYKRPSVREISRRKKQRVMLERSRAMQEAEGRASLEPPPPLHGIVPPMGGAPFAGGQEQPGTI